MINEKFVLHLSTNLSWLDHFYLTALNSKNELFFLL